MIEKGKISSFQMAIMMHPTILATAILLVPSITAKHAKQDLWMSPIWAAVSGIVTAYLAYRLCQLYPQKTLIEYSEALLGRFFGKVLGFMFILFYFYTDGIVLREYGEFVVGTFLPRTPMIVVIGAITLTCAFAVYGGIEVIARSSQIIVPVVVLLFLVIIILLLQDLDWKNMLPVFENGLGPSFKGSIVPQSWFSEYLLISFMLPYLTDRQKGLKWAVLSVLSVMTMLVLVNFTALFLFGKLTGTLTYPVMVAVRYISLASFLEHLESIVMAIWVSGTFIKICVFYYAIVLGSAQWLKLSDFRPIVLPSGFILMTFSLWTADSLQELVTFLGTTFPFFALTFQLLIPLMMLIFALFRQKFGKGKGKMKA
ncbi:MAG TPA: endospore germination permease [Bacilli bacterium]